MLKLNLFLLGFHFSLITVQDNTILKHYTELYEGQKGLITVQDNTMLKLCRSHSVLSPRLITVQDNTMLKPAT